MSGVDYIGRAQILSEATKESLSLCYEYAFPCYKYALQNAVTTNYNCVGKKFRMP